MPPMTRMMSRPVVSMSVMTVLTHTDSVMPRKFSSDSTTMNAMAMRVVGTPSTNDSKYSPPKTRARVPAAAMVAASRQNVTRNVSGRLPNALCVYSAAPAACGYLVMSSA